MGHLREEGICDEAEKHNSHGLAEKIISVMVDGYEVPEIEFVSASPKQPVKSRKRKRKGKTPLTQGVQARGAPIEWQSPLTILEGNDLLQGQTVDQEDLFGDDLGLFFNCSLFDKRQTV